MKQEIVLTSIGAVATIGLATSIYLKVKSDQENKLTNELIAALNKLFNPAIGLVSENAFDVHYKDKIKSATNLPVIALHTQVAADHAQQLHDQLGQWWSGSAEVNKVYNIFRTLQDKVQVSQVSKAYALNHQEHLIDRLKDRLSEKELNTVLKIVSDKEDFRIAS